MGCWALLWLNSSEKAKDFLWFCKRKEIHLIFGGLVRTKRITAASCVMGQPLLLCWWCRLSYAATAMTTGESASSASSRRMSAVARRACSGGSFAWCLSGRCACRSRTEGWVDCRDGNFVSHLTCYRVHVEVFGIYLAHFIYYLIGNAEKRGVNHVFLPQGHLVYAALVEQREFLKEFLQSENLTHICLAVFVFWYRRAWRM